MMQLRSARCVAQNVPWRRSCSRSLLMPRRSLSAPSQENSLPSRRHTPTGANLSSWIMPTAAAASAYKPRANFGSLAHRPSQCFPTASFGITAHRQTSETSLSARCCMSGPFFRRTRRSLPCLFCPSIIEPRNAGNAGIGSAPAENHVLLLEDEPSHCQREGMVWKLKEVELTEQPGDDSSPSRQAKAGEG